MDIPYRLVLATRNPGKVDEIRALLADLPVELVAADALEHPPSVIEDAPTLRGNARKKALAFFEYTGWPALADDTGLEVDALGGRPGVRTARYAGPDATPEDNNRQLLDELAGRTDRRARFRTVAAFVDETGETRFFTGTCEGEIAPQPRGTNGFGYDPVFVPADSGRTFAEMNADEKNRISHRKQALQAFRAHLRHRLSNDA